MRFITVILGLFLVSFKSSKQEFHINGNAQGTTYTITYYSNKQVVTKKAIDSIFKAIDKSLSIYHPQSLISKFNASGTFAETDKHLLIVAKESLKIYKETAGKFDITVYPLVNAWGFGNEKISSLPDSNRIKEILPCVGSDKLEVSKGKLIKKSACLKIDVNGIAQGYSVDVVADYLQHKGIKNYIVEVGGELRVKGKKPNGDMMKVGIESPSEDSFSEPIIRKVVSLKSGAITTSGNYRKYITSDDKKRKLSHLIDPFTGYPLQGKLISVTVIAKKAITADGYDNALMAMNIEDALSFVKRKKNMEAYFIYLRNDGTVADTCSGGFRKFLVDIK